MTERIVFTLTLFAVCLAVPQQDRGIVFSKIEKQFVEATDDAVIQLPPGETVIISPLRLTDCDRVTIQGPSTIRYRGPAAPGVVTLARCGYCTMKDVTIIVEADGVDAGVLITNLPGVSPVGKISTANTLERVRVVHAGQAQCPRRAFSVDSRPLGGADANNEFHTFAQCQAFSFSEAGFYAWGSQAHRLRFGDCDADGVHNGGKFGLHSEHGVNFEWHGGTINRVKTNFRLGTMHMRAWISSMNSEHCERFLWLGTSGNSAPLTVEHCRWNGEPPASGDPMFFAWTLGAVTMRSNEITSTTNVMPRVEVNCYQRQLNGRLQRMYGSCDISRNTFTIIKSPTAAEFNKPTISFPASWFDSDCRGNVLIAEGRIEQPAKVGRIP